MTEAANMPDTYGLPEYFVSSVVTEIDGPNVRIICGVTRGGQTHWLFSYVMRADLLFANAIAIRTAAEEAFALQQQPSAACSLN